MQTLKRLRKKKNDYTAILLSAETLWEYLRDVKNDTIWIVLFMFFSAFCQNHGWREAQRTEEPFFGFAFTRGLYGIRKKLGITKFIQIPYARNISRKLHIYIYIDI